MGLRWRVACVWAVALTASLAVGGSSSASRLVRAAAGGGPDLTALVGQNVRVHSGLSDGASGHEKFRWRIVKATRGARAILIDRRAATPSFRAERPGTYVLRGTITGASGTSHAEVRISVRPNDDPPIGVPLETLSNDPSAAIRINGEGVPSTYDRNGIFVAVLERRTRALATWGTVPHNGTGVAQLVSIAKQYSGTDGYVMIVSGPHGVPREAFLEFDRLADLIGAPRLTQAAGQELDGGQPFSIIGIPGGAKDAAWVNIGRTAGTGNRPGEILGYLTYNPATGFYDYVNPDRPTFDTQSLGPKADHNVISVNLTINHHQEYEADLPPGSTAGFHVLVLDSATLEPLSNVALPTNGAADVAGQQLQFAARLQNLVGPGAVTHPPLVILQSIGHPKGQSPGWAPPPSRTPSEGSAADTIGRLGGTRLVFNSLDGRRDYALVGSLDAGNAAVESNITAGHGRLVGALARSHDMSFKPTLAGPPSRVNTEMVQMAYQPPKPFPAFDTPLKRAAETYIGKRIHLCGMDAQTCPIRQKYYEVSNDAVKHAELELRDRDLDCPADPDSSYCRDTYDPVRRELKDEFSAVVRVRNYFAELRVPFDKAQVPGRVHLEAITKTFYDAVNPPKNANATSRGLELASKLTSLAGNLLPSPAGNVAKGISSTLGLTAFFTRKDGSSELADTVRFKAGDLATKLQDQMYDAAANTKALEYLFVSDYGKLMDIAKKIATSEWTLAGDDASLNELELAARRWYAEQLTPVVYPWLVRGHPLPPVGPGDANGLNCQTGKRPEYPWSSEPAKAQIRPIDGWNDKGEASRPIYFFSANIYDIDSASPAQDVVNLLFDPQNARTGALGLDPAQFLSPRVFGKLRIARDNWPHCAL